MIRGHRHVDNLDKISRYAIILTEENCNVVGIRYSRKRLSDETDDFCLLYRSQRRIRRPRGYSANQTNSQ